MKNSWFSYLLFWKFYRKISGWIPSGIPEKTWDTFLEKKKPCRNFVQLVPWRMFEMLVIQIFLFSSLVVINLMILFKNFSKTWINCLRDPSKCSLYKSLLDFLGNFIDEWVSKLINSLNFRQQYVLKFLVVFHVKLV